LERVRFENCRMEEVDFYEATLSSVAFLSCDLTKRPEKMTHPSVPAAATPRTARTIPS
jgi:uncharacterized protein YjbI with pentapeptide repeats